VSDLTAWASWLALSLVLVLYALALTAVVIGRRISRRLRPLLGMFTGISATPVADSEPEQGLDSEP
jgi:hypothetical protein